ncbi:MAG: hypothetical protein ACRDOO_26635 [Actinomadura sp.]
MSGRNDSGGWSSTLSVVANLIQIGGPIGLVVMAFAKRQGMSSLDADDTALVVAIGVLALSGVLLLLWGIIARGRFDGYYGPDLTMRRLFSGLACIAAAVLGFIAL